MANSIRQIRMDERLWNSVLRAAANEGARRGKPYSASEWVRSAVEEKLEVEALAQETGATTDG